VVEKIKDKKGKFCKYRETKWTIFNAARLRRIRKNTRLKNWTVFTAVGLRTSLKVGECSRKLRECSNTPRRKILHLINFNPVRVYLISF